MRWIKAVALHIGLLAALLVTLVLPEHYSYPGTRWGSVIAWLWQGIVAWEQDDDRDQLLAAQGSWSDMPGGGDSRAWRRPATTQDAVNTITRGLNRGLGYCTNPECATHKNKSSHFLVPGVSLVSTSFTCDACGEPGKVVAEEGFASGDARDVFKEVRVSFAFDPHTDTYKYVAIVRDDAVPGDHRVYTLRSPFVSTKIRALKVAENTLAGLNQQWLETKPGGPSAYMYPTILSFDDSREKFFENCEDLGKALRESPLAQKSFQVAMSIIEQGNPAGIALGRAERSYVQPAEIATPCGQPSPLTNRRR